MTTFVRFYRKRTWHVVAAIRADAQGTRIATMCGEPSIDANPNRDQAKNPIVSHRETPPAYVCERCQKANER